MWNKYRPAILQMMVAAAEGPQQYKFFGHEFKTLNPREKSGYSFTLQAHEGKATNNIKTSTAAKDLLSVLETSRKASELMAEGEYEFTLDKQFVLHVSKMEASPAGEETA